jgi:hypothetical protein
MADVVVMHRVVERQSYSSRITEEAIDSFPDQAL